MDGARRTLRLPDPLDLDDALARAEPDGHGLTVLPFLAGERSPGWKGDAKAAVLGITQATRPVDILQAALEAVAYRIGLVFDLLQPLADPGPRVVAAGGAVLVHPAWLQIITDVLGVPVTASQVREASARGAALLALESMGALEDLSAAPSFLGPSFEPRTDHHRRYREAMKRQAEAYDKLVGD